MLSCISTDSSKSFADAVSSDGSTGFILEDDHGEYTGVWLDEDSHRDGYRPEWLEDRGW